MPIECTWTSIQVEGEIKNTFYIWPVVNLKEQICNSVYGVMKDKHLIKRACGFTIVFLFLAENEDLCNVFQLPVLLLPVHAFSVQVTLWKCLKMKV